MLEDRTTGDTLWIGHAQYDARGELVGMSRKIYLRGLQLHSDHSYRLTAVYDNPTGAVLKGAMGKIGGVFVAGTDVRLAADRADPQYVIDFDVMTNHAHEHQHGHSAAPQAGGAGRHQACESIGATWRNEPRAPIARRSRTPRGFLLTFNP